MTRTSLSIDYFQRQLDLLFLQAKQERDAEINVETERYKKLDFLVSGLCELSDRLERGDVE